MNDENTHTANCDYKSKHSAVTQINAHTHTHAAAASCRWNQTKSKCGARKKGSRKIHPKHINLGFQRRVNCIQLIKTDFVKFLEFRSGGDTNTQTHTQNDTHRDR